MESSNLTQLVTTRDDKESDSDEVRWTRGEKQVLGYGFKDHKDGRIGLIRCPVCGEENYAPSVISGICYACGFDANA